MKGRFLLQRDSEGIMYQSGSYVVYGAQGVCRVIGTEIQRINRTKSEFLILEPIEKAESRFYLPTGNPAVIAKIRPVLTPEELRELFRSSEIQNGVWIPDENRRKQQYRELLSGADRMALLKMLLLVYRHRDQQLAAGRKFHQCDDNFMHDAEKLLCSEISLVLQMAGPEARIFLREQLNG